ncbi:hypothetical protein ABZU25_31915 [Micromonospora sp. NPDC005215]|uniref:hypothetical protein n=1 Tax=Micromonospora sp. NPDC005215 TaxID=3157024 RepID=UPI0033A779BA
MLVAVVAVLIPIMGNGNGERPGTPGADSDGGRASTIQTNSEGCDAQGSGSVVTCEVGSKQSYGQVSLTYFVDMFSFAGAARDLPTPPDYPAETTTDHCEDWQTWVAENPAMYSMTPYIDLEMLSGDADLVVIKSAEVTVFKRTPSAGQIALTCRHGGGDAPSYVITVDTVEGRSTLSTFDGPDQVDGPDLMPPASIQLTERGYRYATIVIASKENYLYEGALKVRTVINGAELTYQLGSAERPLRWTRSTWNDSDPVPLDWNRAKRQWSDSPW